MARTITSGSLTGILMPSGPFATNKHKQQSVANHTPTSFSLPRRQSGKMVHTLATANAGSQSAMRLKANELNVSAFVGAKIPALTRRSSGRLCKGCRTIQGEWRSAKSFFVNWHLICGLSVVSELLSVTVGRSFGCESAASNNKRICLVWCFFESLLGLGIIVQEN
jgi:hypothetical protein